MTHRRWSALLFAAVSLCSSSVLAQEVTTPRHELRYSSATFARYNALGLSTRGWLGYQYNLYTQSQSVLLGDCYLNLGLAPEITPAIMRAGPQVVLKPLAILELSALYERLQYLGTFGHIHYMGSPQEPYSDDVLLEYKERGEFRSSGYTQLNLAARLQGKVGPVAARSKLTGVYIHQVDLKPGQRTFYDPNLDSPAAVGSWTLITDSDLLYLGVPGWTLGLRHTWQRPYFQSRHYAPGEAQRPGADTQHRVGPLVAWNLSSDPEERSSSTAFLLVQWWLKHPSRTGQEVSQAIPMIVVGYALGGSLWSR